MKLKYVTSLIVLLLGLSCKKTDFGRVESVVENEVLAHANMYLDAKPITVTANISKRSSGSKHDFYSEGDYWWPNPKHPDSAYIRKDGLTNPDNFVAHRRAMIRLSQVSGALASAYLITKDTTYLNRLMPHLQAWFVDESTKMNPNLLYAQAIKGRVTGRGIGIIDTIHLIEVALAVQVVEQSNTFSKKDISAIKSWFTLYLEWLTTHKYGLKERDNGNNHSTCWAMQVAAFAKLVNNVKQLEFCRNFYKTTLLPDQMALDGSFPKELSRTKPYGYSVFNLDAMASLAQLLSSAEDNIFQYTTPEGKGLNLGLQFLYPYINNKNSWPYQKDVMYWDDWPVKQPALLFGALQLQNVDYFQTWSQLPDIPNKAEILRNMPVRYPLLWVYN